MKSDLLLPLMTGIDIPIPELSLTIHPPRIEEIAFMGENKFFNTVQYFCLDKDLLIKDKNVSLSLTNFQIFMKVLEQSQGNKKNAVQTFLALLFPQYSSVILPTSILLSGEDGSNTHIEDQNFPTLQMYIKEILCVSSILQQDNIIYNPSNEEAKKIAEKFYEGRRKRAELNQDKQQQTSVLARYLSILEIARVITPLEGPKLTLFQLFDLMERYTAFLEWEIDKQVRLAGGTPDKPADNWMRDLHSNNNDTQAFTSSMINSKTQK